MTSFLERAALHQTRFRTPGVQPDARGVVLGHRGLVLFASLDRVVAFFRAYGEEGSLDELLPTLTIQQVRSPLKTRELVVSFGAESSYRMDRVASVARLAGGDVFTGTQRHYVKYRDATSPLGYDIAQVVDSRSELVVYHDSYRQTYDVEREVPFRELIVKLAPVRRPPGDESASLERILVTAETGIGHALVGYLFRWNVRARVALAEWPSASAFDDRPRRQHVFDVTACPSRIVALLRGLPGVNVFEPLGTTFAVELGFRHPIALESCQSLFPAGSLTLFRGDGFVVSVDPLPTFAAVETLVRTSSSLDAPSSIVSAQDRGAPSTFVVPLRLAPTIVPSRRVVATVIPAQQREYLAKLLYVLPPRTLASLRLAAAEDALYLLDPRGVEGVPLGRFFSEIATKIYVPMGMALVPAVQPHVLEALWSGQRDHHVFYVADGAPRLVPEASFQPLSRSVLGDLQAVFVSAQAPGRVDPPLPEVVYAHDDVLPLWGAPGRAQTTSSGLALPPGSGRTSKA